ncbi:hypothetical protein M8009_08740 [Halomonas sp. ATCH28]|uniref:Secreted protein n=1 Tax=Halomonas gemina TaxID=2945105 RepID=A0ABT0T0I9_9GAMM|nr:hypothetical protein [Halomonas gemina]MCL7940383.1 hypothetical protein [Halomonas gemina]
MNKLLAILALILLATTAVAQESSGSSGSENGSAAADERMEEHLEKADSNEQGTTEAPGGGAEPTENWFGCPPAEGDKEEGDQQEECEKQRNETDDEEGAS